MKGNKPKDVTWLGFVLLRMIFFDHVSELGDKNCQLFLGFLLVCMIFFFFTCAHIQISFSLSNLFNYRFPYCINLYTWSTQQIIVAQLMCWFLKASISPVFISISYFNFIHSYGMKLKYWIIRCLKESAHMLVYLAGHCSSSIEMNTIWEPIIKKVRYKKKKLFIIVENLKIDGFCHWVLWYTTIMDLFFFFKFFLRTYKLLVIRSNTWNNLMANEWVGWLFCINPFEVI